MIGVQPLCMGGFAIIHKNSSPPPWLEERVCKPGLSKWVCGLWPACPKCSQSWFSAQLLGLAFLEDTFFSFSFLTSPQTRDNWTIVPPLFYLEFPSGKITVQIPQIQEAYLGWDGDDCDGERVGIDGSSLLIQFAQSPLVILLVIFDSV